MGTKRLDTMLLGSIVSIYDFTYLHFKQYMRKLPVAVLILEVFVYEDDKRYVGHWFMFRTMHISSPIHLHTIELISKAVVETDLLAPVRAAIHVSLTFARIMQIKGASSS